MGPTDTKWITGLAALESYVLRSPHIVIGQLQVKFRPSSNGESLDMSYNAIEKTNAHVRPQPEVSFSISKKEYLVLMRCIGDSQNVKSTCLQFSPLDKLDSVFPGFFLSCIKGFAELCRALCTNSTMSTLQIQLSDKAPDEGFQDQVTLVRPLTTDSDGQQANVDLAKLNVTISGSRMCGAVCDLVFHEVLQSSTLKELTVETLDHSGDMLEGSPSCALLRAVVRPLIVDEAGQQAKANLTKLTLALPSVRVNGTSPAIFAEILPDLLQRNSTLKELTVKAPHFYEEREETREEKLCALLQPLKENKSLEILDLSDCQGILTQRVIPTLMDILLVNFTLRHINFGDSSIWYGVKEQLRKQEKYMQSCLRTLPVAKAQAARVFLCGGPYAGMCHGIGVILHMLCLT